MNTGFSPVGLNHNSHLSTSVPFQAYGTRRLEMLLGIHVILALMVLPNFINQCYLCFFLEGHLGIGSRMLGGLYTNDHCDQCNSSIVKEKSLLIQCHFTLSLKHEEWPRPQLDENMTCNPTCYKIDKDSWSPGFCGKTTSKGCLARFLGWPSHSNNLDWFVYIIF